MISGVLNLAERPIRTVMTVRAEVDAIDLAQPAEVITQALIIRRTRACR
jgi:CBS domain containing-hemolysin-like protein